MVTVNDIIVLSKLYRRNRCGTIFYDLFERKHGVTLDNYAVNTTIDDESIVHEYTQFKGYLRDYLLEIRSDPKNI